MKGTDHGKSGLQKQQTKQATEQLTHAEKAKRHQPHSWFDFKKTESVFQKGKKKSENIQKYKKRNKTP